MTEPKHDKPAPHHYPTKRASLGPRQLPCTVTQEARPPSPAIIIGHPKADLPATRLASKTAVRQ